MSTLICAGNCATIYVSSTKGGGFVVYILTALCAWMTHDMKVKDISKKQAVGADDDPGVVQETAVVEMPCMWK